MQGLCAGRPRGPGTFTGRKGEEERVETWGAVRPCERQLRIHFGWTADSSRRICTGEICCEGWVCRQHQDTGSHVMHHAAGLLLGAKAGAVHNYLGPGHKPGLSWHTGHPASGSMPAASVSMVGSNNYPVNGMVQSAADLGYGYRDTPQRQELGSTSQPHSLCFNPMWIHLMFTEPRLPWFSSFYFYFF